MLYLYQMISLLKRIHMFNAGISGLTDTEHAESFKEMYQEQSGEELIQQAERGAASWGEWDALECSPCTSCEAGSAA